MRQHDPDALLVSGEDVDVREYIESQSVAKLRALVGRRTTLIVDEAQHVRQIGLNLKLLVDHVQGLRIVASGSSSFDLARQTGEPLTGRKRTLLLLPLAQLELAAVETAPETKAQLEMRLIYGSYPEVVLTESMEDREVYPERRVEGRVVLRRQPRGLGLGAQRQVDVVAGPVLPARGEHRAASEAYLVRAPRQGVDVFLDGAVGEEP